MAKVTRVTLTNLDNPSTAVSQINTNFANLQTAMDNTLSRDGTSPNTMLASLDMNSNRIINLPEPENDAEAARKVDVDTVQENLDEIEAALQALVDEAEDFKDNAEAAASNANTSEINSATSAANALTAENNAETAETAAEAAQAATEALLAAFPTITSTDASASAGPNLILDRVSASPANNDVLGRIFFRGRDSGGNATDYAALTSTISDTTDGSEDGALRFWATTAGTLTNPVVISGTQVRIDGAAATTREYTFNTAGTQRWSIRANSNTESGSDAGSDFNINSYTDAGVFKDTVFEITRSTGNITITRTDDGVSAGPNIVLNRLSASPAASDSIAAILFRGKDSAANTTDYASITGFLGSVTDGAETGAIIFRTASSGSLGQRFAVDSYGGNVIGGTLRFPSTQVPSTGANDLDDYEEGTFTPAFSATGATFSYASQVGAYVKVGKLVWFTLRIQLNTSGNTLTANPLTITGLPFTSENTTNQSQVYPVQWGSSTASYVNVNAGLGPNTVNMSLQTMTAAGTSSSTAPNSDAMLHATNGSFLCVTGSYRATA
jgi:hypothetical protein